MEQMSKKELIAMNKNTMSALAAHTICPHWKKGTCNKGAGCTMIHGDETMKEEIEQRRQLKRVGRIKGLDPNPQHPRRRTSDAGGTPRTIVTIAWDTLRFVQRALEKGKS